MVWKIKKMLIICLSLLTLVTTCSSRVSAADLYDGTINSTYLQYARDLMTKVKFTDDYVFFRSGQYTYEFVTGDINYNGTSFSGTDVEIYKITQPSGTGMNNTQVTIYSDTYPTFTLQTTGKLVYSNLGQFPTLEERGGLHESIQTILICILAMCMLIRGVFIRR